MGHNPKRGLGGGERARQERRYLTVENHEQLMTAHLVKE